MKNIFLTLITLFLITSCSEDREGLNIVNEDLNNELLSAKLDLESKLNTYKDLLNKNNTSFASKESLTTLNSVLNITTNKKKSSTSKAATNLTENQITHVSYLGTSLSNSETPEEALEILNEDYEAILNSETLTVNEKSFLLIVNNSIKMSTEFVVAEFDNNNKNSSLAKRRSWWGSLTKAYADLTDDFVGIMAVAIFPGPCVAAIVIGGTINYYNQ
jgi:hypothetical protein